MRLLLVALGSRGDVLPFVALGRGLAAAGHEVTVAAADDFAGLIAGQGLTHAGFGIQLSDELAHPLVVRWLAGSDHLRGELRNLRAVADFFAPRLAGGLAAMSGAADAFISGLLALPALVPVARGTGRGLVAAMLQPMLPTRTGAAATHAPVPHRTSLANLAATWALTVAGYPLVRSSIRLTAAHLGLARPGLAGYLGGITNTPTLVGASPALVPQPADWPGQALVTGYWRLPTPAGYQPPAGLAEFLAAGPPPVYLGFGSMPSRDVGRLRDLAMAALVRSGRRAILAGALHAGGPAMHPLGPGVVSVGEVDHDWLFPQVAAVVCHGGAGTTGTALTAGVPVGVVAHMGDQPYWGRRVHDLGVGPAPVHRSALTEDRLVALLDALADPGTGSRAAALGRRLSAEDGVAAAVAAITGWLR